MHLGRYNHLTAHTMVNDDAAHLKLCFARYCWTRRDELCPNLVDTGKGKQRITWGQCFEMKYKQTLDEFKAERSK